MTGVRGKRRDSNHSYQDLRSRNNVAVRKSREKARSRNIELESKLTEERDKNKKLRDQVVMKWRELSLLKCLLVRVKIDPPPNLLRALALKNKYSLFFDSLDPEHHATKCICSQRDSNESEIFIPDHASTSSSSRQQHIHSVRRSTRRPFSSQRYMTGQNSHN
ncbi:glutathione peroxidase [Cichlidogyrus casuarinus]|uniref:Glutathione peroxidase n=1 Tax=Cichlidogyrus casuarinus TaxID=1844966 RepID=A0ABD2Q768_9PLAT